jgi:DnaJ family protein C protein 7
LYRYIEGLFLSNICACEQALGKYADALSSAGTAVAIAPAFVKAHSRLATLYTELDMLADAVAAYKTMLELPLERNEETQARSTLATQTARSKNNRPVNWIKLLGVEASASAADIKKAYRQLALVHHPDKAGRGGVSADVAKARAEMSSKLFKHVGEAQRVLTNAAERAKWESAKARADRQDSYTSRASYTTSSRSSYSADPFSEYSGRYDRYASHWSDLYEDDDYGV